ncbi:unnamed protein product [Diatraea saccharalis]|uniref:N-acyl-aliphatic-L-amino acid amidohydrolase n=1 Tax=Diatraea saccharalis TaxID=40085 RepID=A0A9N9QWK5_9NEOP|nr:unnamed protein product [Diatraea saccharalis]
MADNYNDEVINRLREYLRIPSVHPDVDYHDCVEFFKSQAKSLDLPIEVYEFAPKKPVVIITWKGLEPDLPAILLNSHMDVVPVFEDHWTHPPFDAVLTNDGWLYARGSQDMKSVGMIHLEAVRRLKDAGVILKRTVHVSFVPDEEIGGDLGMNLFTLSEEFKNLNIGFALDESCPSIDDTLLAFHGERTCRQIKVTCLGNPGHGSLLFDNTAGEKLYYMIDKFMKFREAERKKLKSILETGGVTTVNLTMIEGGVQVNVLPEKLSVSFDVRIAPDVDHDEFDNMIQSWCNEAGEGVSFEYYIKNPQIKCTCIDENAVFFTALKDSLDKMGIKLNCLICPGTTDARYIRKQGIPAINLTPMTNTPLLIHAHDERIHVDRYREGIDIMEKMLTAIANV